MPISLLPPKKKKKARLNIAAIFGNMPTSLSLGLLVILSGAYGGLAIYERNIEEGMEDIIAMSQDIAAERDTKLENEVLDFSTKLQSIQGLLDAHIYPSAIFPIIESLTQPQTQFTSFSFHAHTGEVIMSGLTANFSTLSEQVIAIERNENISKTDFKDIKLGKEGRVSFTVSFVINKEIYGQ